MFDPTSAQDLAALRAEVFDNVAHYPQDERGTPLTETVLQKINDPALNRVPDETVRRPIDDIRLSEVAAVIDETEYSLLGPYGQAWVRMVISRPPDVELREYKTKFQALFDPGGTTVTAVLAIRDRPASRAETLFGRDTLISRKNWFAARDS